jgi:hypothetical protein
MAKFKKKKIVVCYNNLTSYKSYAYTTVATPKRDTKMTKKNYDIVIKLLVRSILYLRIIIIIGSKKILIFIALNRERTFMINDK